MLAGAYSWYFLKLNYLNLCFPLLYVLLNYEFPAPGERPEGEGWPPTSASWLDLVGTAFTGLRASTSRTIATICSSLNRLLFMFCPMFPPAL